MLNNQRVHHLNEHWFWTRILEGLMLLDEMISLSWHCRILPQTFLAPVSKPSVSSLIVVVMVVMLGLLDHTGPR